MFIQQSNITNLDTDDETFTDVFTYTVSDGEDTHTATITITIEASAAPTARNDTGKVNEDATLTVSDADNATSEHSEMSLTQVTQILMIQTLIATH